MSFLPSIKQLQYLVALAEHRSFSRAAEYCHVTQPTLSAGIAALEDQLGQPLVNRSFKAVTLTPLGLETVERAQRIITEAQAIVDRFQYASNPLAGPLRLGIIPTVAPYMLPAILPRIQKTYPGLEIQLHEDLSARLVDSLQKGLVDLAIMAFPYEAEELEYHNLFKEPFVLAAPKDYWKDKKPVATSDLKSHRLLLLEEGHCLRDHALAACKLEPRYESKTFSATSLATLMQMVQHGYGITLLPQMAVNAKAVPRYVDVVHFKKPYPSRMIGMAWRRGNPRRDAFIELGRTITKAING